MGLFGSNVLKYKGYEITKDQKTGIFYIRSAGRFGTSLGTAESVEKAKQLIDENG